MSSHTPRRWTRWPSGSRTSSRGTTGAKGQHRDQLLAVLNAVTKAANWQPKVSASNLSDANVVTGRGVAWQDAYNPIAMAQTAAIADVEVNKKTGKVTVKHVYHAMSAGLAVYPDGIENQIVGGTVQIRQLDARGAGARSARRTSRAPTSSATRFSASRTHRRSRRS